MKQCKFFLIGILMVTFSCVNRNQFIDDNPQVKSTDKSHIENDASKDEIFDNKVNLLDSLKALRANHLKLKSKVVDTMLWFERWSITIYYNHDNELVMMDCKNTYSPDLEGSNDDYIEWHFFNSDGSYFLYQEIGFNNYITEITQNKGELRVKTYYPKQNKTNEILDDNIRASKISAWNFHNAVYLIFFDGIKYQGFGEITSTIPNIVVDIDSMMLYKHMGFDSEVLKTLLEGSWLSYAGVIEKDKDSNRFWIKVMDIKDNKLGWINCDLTEIKPFNG